MFPELQSPTSPDDQPMNEPKMPSTTSPMSHVADNQLQSCPVDVVKSSGTLKNNIDLKDQTNKKRTSLHIENSSTATTTTTTSSITQNIAAPSTDRTSKRWSSISNGDDTKEVTSITRDFAINLDNAVRTDNNNEVYSDCDNNGCGTGILSTSIVDNNLIDTNRYQSSWHKVTDNNKVNGTGNYDETEEDDDEADYNDMEEENGNSTDSTRKRDSVTSRESSDDYFLCEKFKNSLNTNLQNALNDSGKMAALELLSPHEGPLGRRYAEIAHFKAPNTR